MHNSHRQSRTSSSSRARHGGGQGQGRTFHAHGRRPSGSGTERNSTRHHSRPHGRFSGARQGQGGRRGRVQKTFDVSQFINKNPVINAEPEVFTPKHTFTEFGLDQRVVGAVLSQKLTSPTPIQDEIIPHILEGRDVIGLANTGTGKTAAFLLPLIHKTLREYGRQTLILTPTRELALQIEGELRKFSVAMRLYSTTCVGGTNIRPQIQGLKRKNHFIIGTPGRIIDLIDRGNFRTQTVTTVVLDEADRMLDMGFIGDIRTILKDIPASRETFFFSATMPAEIERLVHDFLRDPVTVSVKKRDITTSVHQDVIRYQHVHKFETLTELLGNPSMKRVLVFGAMKHSVEKLAKQLALHGIKAESIHGNKSHSQRQRALQSFKSGHSQVLVATDVAARGIHVDNVSHVINYDLPGTYEDYIHRIGRTGRGKEQGQALTFVEA